jgi:hypothetical protein
LLQRTAQRSAQLLGILLPGANLCGGVRMIGQPGVDQRRSASLSWWSTYACRSRSLGGMLII